MIRDPIQRLVFIVPVEEQDGDVYETDPSNAEDGANKDRKRIEKKGPGCPVHSTKVPETTPKDASVTYKQSVRDQNKDGGSEGFETGHTNVNAAEKTADDKSAADKAATDKAAVEKVAIEKAAVEKAAAEAAVATKAAAKRASSSTKASAEAAAKAKNEATEAAAIKKAKGELKEQLRIDAVKAKNEAALKVKKDEASGECKKSRDPGSFEEGPQDDADGRFSDLQGPEDRRL